MNCIYSLHDVFSLCETNFAANLICAKEAKHPGLLRRARKQLNEKVEKLKSSLSRFFNILVQQPLKKFIVD